jgi:hypothetical protein
VKTRGTVVIPVDIAEQGPKWKALDRWENEGGMIPVNGQDVFTSGSPDSVETANLHASFSPLSHVGVAKLFIVP